MILKKALVILSAAVLTSCGTQIGSYSVPISQSATYTQSAVTEKNLLAATDESADSSENIEDISADSSSQLSPAHDLSRARTVPLTEDSVKIMGRTALIDDILWCTMSATGVEFEYTGKNLNITLVSESDSTNVSNHRPRVGIYVDGERTEDILLDTEETEVSVFESDETETVTVKIIKLSESEMSTFGIAPIELEAGEDIVPTENKSLSIEFIGDSITCGYGVDDENPNHSFSTATEDITKSFAAITAENLDADYSVFAASGYGIYSGYTSSRSKRTERELIPSYYDTLGYSCGSFGGDIYPQNLSYDFDRTSPDVIVINLGTNDSTYCGSDETKLSEFVNLYVDFLKDIREKNPDSEIVCSIDAFCPQIWDSVQAAAEKYSAQTGDEKVHAFLISVDGGSCNAADWHPTYDTHKIMAESLTEYIRSIIE
jgi:lysophospholipase L1-like esterase